MRLLLPTPSSPTIHTRTSLIVAAGCHCVWIEGLPRPELQLGLELICRKLRKYYATPAVESQVVYAVYTLRGDECSL